MSKLKTLIMGTLTACAISLPVLADDMKMHEGQMMLLTTSGELHIMSKPDKSMYDYMMKKGDPMPTNVVMMMTQDGKMVITKDAKMDDGKMLSEVLTAK